MTSTNPYRPGAGQAPPYLAGRDNELMEFDKLLEQDIILENLIITGLRGIGKTVLLETLKPRAVDQDWLWTGDEFSQSLGISEDRLAMRILADIAFITTSVQIGQKQSLGFGLGDGEKQYLNFDTLRNIYQNTPGLSSDKLKNVLEIVWTIVPRLGKRGIVFAYDEAQTLTDNTKSEQFPLSLLLDVFQSIQRKGIRFMLVLTGLPTLQPNLVATRTYTERMFNVFMLQQLKEDAIKDAIKVPLLNQDGSPKKDMLQFSESAVEIISTSSGGYPYFIQYICRETYDAFLQKQDNGEEISVPVDSIMEKLDNNFFYGRWAKATDREKELMTVIAKSRKDNFTPTQLSKLTESDEDIKTFSLAQVAGYLRKLIDEGLIYKDKRGKYSFAVPLFGGYILRGLDRK